MFRYVFLIGCIFVGCEPLKTRDQEPDIISKVELSEKIDSAITTPNFKLGDWPSNHWWEVFDDSQLSTMIEKVISSNPEFLAAASRVQQAQQAAFATRSVLFPKLYGSADNNYQHLSDQGLFRYPPSDIPAVINQVNLSLDFEYEIDVFGKNKNRYLSSMSYARAAAADMSASLLMLTTMFAGVYMDYSFNLKRIAFDEELKDLYKQLLDLVKSRVDNGLEDQIAVDEAMVQYLNIQKQLVYDKKIQDLYLSQMYILMGESPDSGFVETTINDSLLNTAFSLPKDLPMNLLSRRPDVMACLWNVEAEAYSVKVSKAAFFPNINLSAFIASHTLKWDALLSASSYASSLNAAVNLPIFTGGKLTAGLRRQYAAYDTAVYEYNRIVLRAAQEVFDAITSLEAADSQRVLQGDVVAQFDHTLLINLYQYDNGIIDKLILIYARIDTIRALIKDIDTNLNKVSEVLRLIKALGGGYHGRSDNESKT